MTTPNGNLVIDSDVVDIGSEHDQNEPLHPVTLDGRADLVQLWEVWSAAGEAATAEAHCRLKAQGIGVIAKRQGVVIEELPDGTVHPLNTKGSN